VQAARLEPGERIALDGTLSHPAWQRAPVFADFVERDPKNGAKPKYETRVQVLYSERAVYVGVTALDDDASEVRETLVRHDQVKRTQDFVAVYLDPMGRKRAAQWFRIGAAGSTADGLHTAEDDSEDFSPDFDFDAASTRHERGYTAVFRIPFTSLRYTRDGLGPWRMMVVRRVPREQIYLWMSVPLAQEAQSFIDNLQPLDGVSAPTDGRFLQLRPNLTLRRTHDAPATGPRVSDNEAKPGLDAKWRPLPELVIDATLKPDFSQVELDTPQLRGNTSFALFLPEKRPFFLESSDLLRSPTDAVYTRSITQPRWGLRGTWRSDAFSATAFAARDDGGGLVLLPGAYGSSATVQPASHAASARVRTDHDGLVLGAVAGLRRYVNDGGDNIVLGPDVTWNPTPAWRVRAQWLHSRTSALADAATGELARGLAQNGNRLFATAYWKSDHYEAGGEIEDVSEDFRHDNGFVSQTGVRRFATEWHRSLRGAGPFNELWLNLFANTTRDRVTSRTVSSNVTPEAYFAYSRNSEVTLAHSGLSRTRLAPDAALLEERYWRISHSRLWATWMPNARIEWQQGHMIDFGVNQVRPGRRVALNASLRPFSRLELEPSYTVLRFGGDGAAQYEEVASRLLAIAHLSARQTVRWVSQVSRAERDSDAMSALPGFAVRSRADSLTYTWRKSAGSVLYVGATRGTFGPRAVQSRSTEWFIKLQADVDEWRDS
jgi:hypothetical protein